MNIKILKTLIHGSEVFLISLRAHQIALQLFGALLAFAASSSFSYAENFPARPIRLITLTSAGSGVDVVARQIASQLSASLGQPVVVENMPGAGGVLGAQAIAKAPKNGYTIGMAASSLAIFPFLNKNLGFNARKDIEPISMIFESPMVLVSRPDFPADTAGQLAQLAKAAPGTLTLGSGGNGTNLHLAGEYMQQVGGFKLIHIPYKGVAASLVDLMSGVVDVGFAAPASVDSLIKSGRLKALGVSGKVRLEAFPKVPTIMESIPGFEIDSWAVIVAPSGLPADVVAKLTLETNKVIASDEFRALVVSQGGSVKVMNGKPLRQFVESEFARYEKLIKDVGLSAD